MSAMLSRRSILSLVVAWPLLMMAGCDSFDKDIEAVQRAESIVPGMSNDALAREISGVRGVVKWLATETSDDDILLVTAKIQRISRLGNRREAQLQFVRNRQSGQIEFEQATIDNQPQSLLGGAMNLFLLQME